jgi:tetratricopeptide (TPR) repeat protein
MDSHNGCPSRQVAMINKDYILRMAEKFGRALAIILHLRKANQYEEVLIYIDDLFLQVLGLTSSFINSMPEDVILNMISPMGRLSIEKCLWIAVLLRSEGDIFLDQGNTDESYYRYLKSLHFFLTLPPQGNNVPEVNIPREIDDLLLILGDYELPLQIKTKLFSSFEAQGRYAKAEDALFEALESGQDQAALIEAGLAFYARLQKRSDVELARGNFSRDEVAEGLAQLKGRR